MVSSSILPTNLADLLCSHNFFAGALAVPEEKIVVWGVNGEGGLLWRPDPKRPSIYLAFPSSFYNAAVKLKRNRGKRWGWGGVRAGPVLMELSWQAKLVAPVTA
jgi:hypothetical protein